MHICHNSLHAALVPLYLHGAVWVRTGLGDEASQLLGHGVLVHVDVEAAMHRPPGQQPTLHRLMCLQGRGRGQSTHDMSLALIL